MMTKSNQTAKNVLIKHEAKMSRHEAATLLESIASKLKEEGSFTLNIGEKSQKVEPTEQVKLELELEEKNGKYEFEFELEWREGDSSKKELTIE